MLLFAYGTWAAVLLVFADEGPIPARSRLPEVPEGVLAVSETKECASGGCWRQLMLHPPAGRSPEDLASDLGLTDEKREGWRLLDPRPAVIGSVVSGDELRIYLRYVAPMR